MDIRAEIYNVQGLSGKRVDLYIDGHKFEMMWVVPLDWALELVNKINFKPNNTKYPTLQEQCKECCHALDGSCQMYAGKVIAVDQNGVCRNYLVIKQEDSTTDPFKISMRDMGGTK